MEVAIRLIQQQYFWRVWQNTEWVPDDERYQAYWNYMMLKEL